MGVHGVSTHGSAWHQYALEGAHSIPAIHATFHHVLLRACTQVTTVLASSLGGSVHSIPGSIKVRSGQGLERWGLELGGATLKLQNHWLVVTLLLPACVPACSWSPCRAT